MGIILVIILIIVCLGGMPHISGSWHNYGWGPSGIVGILVIVLIILLLTGRL